MMIQGSAHRYGANIDTDRIIPARHCTTADAAELAKHALEDLDPDFVGRVQPGDVIIAEENFGCGSSREVAPVTLKGAGVSCIIAKDFARIFFRNAINMGFPVFECPEIVDVSETGDVIIVDLDAWTIENKTRGRKCKPAAYPDEILAIFQAGGLLNRIQAARTQPTA
ncbi:MAG: 3-isopropylmalate dehydratase small subunit [Planctomycetota bacterium]|nr:MAG: 3-isopropylmalate dehydratase small subunit [Planctomycetota bacterium]